MEIIKDNKNKYKLNNNHEIYKFRRIIKSAIVDNSRGCQKVPLNQNNRFLKNSNNFNSTINISINSNNNLNKSSKDSKNITYYTTTFKTNTKTKSNLFEKKEIYRKMEQPEKPEVNHNSFDFSKMTSNRSKSLMAKNEFYNIRKIMDRINNDCTIIGSYIRKKDNEINKSSSFDKYAKEDKEMVLLKLYEKLKELNQIQKLKKRQKKLVKDEKYFTKELQKIPHFAKKFFREVYKQMLYEGRILNKDTKKEIIDEMEEYEMKKRFYESIKNEVRENMILTKDNIISEKDEKKFIEEERNMFGHYGSLEGLEWLLTKRRVINNRKNIFRKIHMRRVKK
jgi:hypothetical protein